MRSEAGGKGADGARRVIVENCQEARAISEDFIQTLEKVGFAALQLIDRKGLVITTIPEEVSVSLVDDVMIAEVHGQYMDDPTPTDVITFPYGETGEIIISIETAEAQSQEYEVSWEREVTLYLVDGMLHLCGYEDSDRVGRDRMEELQAKILEEVSAGKTEPI